MPVVTVEASPLSHENPFENMAQGGVLLSERLKSH